jgi:hypothetical protein
MVCFAQRGIGAHTMDIAVLGIAIGSIYLAGLLAKRRGRSPTVWAWIAAFIGPLAFPLVLMFPNLRGKNGEAA